MIDVHVLITKLNERKIDLSVINKTQEAAVINFNVLCISGSNNGK